MAAEGRGGVGAGKAMEECAHYRERIETEKKCTEKELEENVNRGRKCQ